MRGSKFSRGVILALSLTTIPSLAWAQASTVPYIANGQSASGALQYCVVGTVATGSCPMPTTPAAGGTQDVNLKQVNGSTVTVGAGTGAAGTQRVTTSTDSTIGTVTTVTSATVIQPTAASLNATVVGTGTFAVQSTQAPSSASTAGVAPVQSSSVETGHVIKASAGNLYDFDVTADSTLSAAAWAVMIFNTTTVPAAGAVTPVKCYLMPTGSTTIAAAFPTPLYLGTGISIAVSTGQTCFTKTDSAHGFISADAQ